MSQITLKMNPRTNVEYDEHEEYDDETDDIVTVETLAGYTVTAAIMAGDIEVGFMTIDVSVSHPDDDTQYEESVAYLHRIDVCDGHRNKGYGTKAIAELKNALTSDALYCAPDNADARRLYERIGKPIDIYAPDWASATDQGLGVYRLW